MARPSTIVLIALAVLSSGIAAQRVDLFCTAPGGLDVADPNGGLPSQTILPLGQVSGLGYASQGASWVAWQEQSDTSVPGRVSRSVFVVSFATGNAGSYSPAFCETINGQSAGPIFLTMVVTPPSGVFSGMIRVRAVASCDFTTGFGYSTIESDLSSSGRYDTQLGLGGHVANIGYESVLLDEPVILSAPRLYKFKISGAVGTYDLIRPSWLLSQVHVELYDNTAAPSFFYGVACGLDMQGKLESNVDWSKPELRTLGVVAKSGQPFTPVALLIGDSPASLSIGPCVVCTNIVAYLASSFDAAGTAYFAVPRAPRVGGSIYCQALTVNNGQLAATRGLSFYLN